VKETSECKTQYPIMKIEETDIRKLMEYLEQRPYVEVKDFMSYLTHVLCSINITGGVK